jgi:hypothetical protein
MSVPDNTPIKFSEIRAEGNKTSWVSNKYPKPGSIYNIDPNWMIAKDENHQIGYDPETGEFDLTQMQGWDTYKAPTVSDCYLMQFAKDGGIRVVWTASGGDLWRTGFVVVIGTTLKTTPDSTYDDYTLQNGSEHNSSSSDLKKQYHEVRSTFTLQADHDKLMQVAKTSATWYDKDDFGDYHIGDLDPDSSLSIDVESNPDQSEAMFSFVDPTFDGLAAPSKTYYAFVVAVDARRFDTLSDDRKPDDFTLDRSSNSYPSTTSKVASEGPNWNYGDGRSDIPFGLKLYNPAGGMMLIAAQDFQVSIDVHLNYKYYLDYEGDYYWVYVTDKLSDNSQPYFPQQGYSEDTGPYSDPQNYDIYKIDVWRKIEKVAATNTALTIDGLNRDTKYDIYVLPYRSSDDNRYHLGGYDVSGPKEQDVYRYMQQKTTNSSAAPPKPEIVSISYVSGKKFHMKWTEGASVSHFEVQSRLEDASWSSATIQNLNTNSSPIEADIITDLEPVAGLRTEIRIRAGIAPYPSPWSTTYVQF